jgi:hypothetical protein
VHIVLDREFLFRKSFSSAIRKNITAIGNRKIPINPANVAIVRVMPLGNELLHLLISTRIKEATIIDPQMNLFGSSKSAFIGVHFSKFV